MGYAETGRFHSIHTPTGRVWNEKGLSHGLKTVQWTVFTAAVLPPPFRVPSGVPKIAYPIWDTLFLVRQKGLEPPTY